MSDAEGEVRDALAQREAGEDESDGERARDPTKKRKGAAEEPSVESAATKQKTKKTKKSKKHKHGAGEDGSDGNGAGRAYTVSIAVPGSIIGNAQSPELKAYLAGQIARACAVFRVDEIVVFREAAKARDALQGNEQDFAGAKRTDPSIFLARILQYVETPQYLRKFLFPKHVDLKNAGLLNPLDAPHHMRIDDESEYREGVVLERKVRNWDEFSRAVLSIKEGRGSVANCGMRREVHLDRAIQPSVRVTVQLEPDSQSRKKPKGTVVSPDDPRRNAGLYWGYRVRLAESISEIFTKSSFGEEYDLTIGTSERGDDVHDGSIALPKFKHVIVVFGGLDGLEAAVEADESLSLTGDDTRDLFDYYLNTCKCQGSRTIRTEEAILISMAALEPKIRAAQLQ